SLGREEAFAAIRSLGGYWPKDDPAFKAIIEKNRTEQRLKTPRTEKPLHELSLDEFMQLSEFRPSGKGLVVYDPHGRRWIHANSKSKREAAELLHGNAIRYKDSLATYSCIAPSDIAALRTF